MGIKKTFLVFSVLLLSRFCFAQQISFQIVQHNSTTEEITEQSFILEDLLVEKFFENGFIVTNSPTVNSNSESQDESFWKSGLKDAKNGFSNYFIQIKLYFNQNKNGDEKSFLNKADWTLVSTKSEKILKTDSVKINKLNEDDELFFICENIFKSIKKEI